MRRNLFLLLGLVAAAILPAAGCRSCASCHDYDPPVANCHCDAYGTHRAGSAFGGYFGGYMAEPYFDEADPESVPAEPNNSAQASRF